MQRKTLLPVLTSALTCCLLLCLCSRADAAMFGFLRRGTDLQVGRSDYFPSKGEIPGLEPVGRLLTYRNENFKELYGTAGERYINYGMTKLDSANYEYDGGGLSLEIVTLEEPIQAAGLFHYHRGKVLREPGRDLDAGAEGVLDTGRDGRNLYFYRANMFVKIVYSGKPPIPDLLPVARYVDSKLPSRRDDRPDGIDYIRIEGVNQDTVGITPGFTFNINILPASVWASAPGGGSPASDMFVITRQLERDAQTVFEDYATYLKMYAKSIEEYEVGGRDYVKAVDPAQGRVVFTRYKNAVIIAARPDGYDRGEVLIQRVMDRIDEVQGAGGGQSGDGNDNDNDNAGGEGEGGGRRWWNPFRRK